MTKLTSVVLPIALFMSTFAIETASASPIDWTQNSTFVTSDYQWDLILYKWRWYLDIYGFVIFPGNDTREVFTYDSSNYVRWLQDGVVELAANDPDAFDDYGRSARVTYGFYLDPYFDELPPLLSINDADTLTLKAALSNYGSINLNPIGWTGIKFDAWFRDPTNNDREMVIEMYFHGTGIQGSWGNEGARSLGDVDDYMIKLQAFPEYCTLTGDVPDSNFGLIGVYGWDHSEFLIDLKSIWQRAANTFGRSSADQLFAVALDLESGRTAAALAPLVVAQANEIAVTYTQQDDAGTGADAGNSFSQAMSVSPRTYTGELYEQYDTEDWYRFYAGRGQMILVTVTPPDGADIDLRLYNRFGTLKFSSIGLENYVQFLADSSGEWRIEFFTSTGEGQYAFYLSVITPPPLDGCPYVSTWDGTQYLLDNNLLTASKSSNGTDVADFYLLQKTLIPKGDGTYSLLLSEFENEHDYFDMIQLVAVDHATNVNVAVSPYGEILTYTQPYAAISAHDNSNNQIKTILNSIDGNYYEGYNGSYITLNFGDELNTTQGAKLLVRSDPPDDQYIKDSIHVQTQNAAGNWIDVARIIPRRYWSTDIIDMSPYLPDTRGDLKIRLYFTDNHRVDYVALDRSPQATINVQQGHLVHAEHSIMGDVTAQLLSSNQGYAELTPGQQVEISFTMPAASMETRNYIIIVEGHYFKVD